MFTDFYDKIRECEEQSSKIIVKAYEDADKIIKAAQEKVEAIIKAAQGEVAKKGKVVTDNKPQPTTEKGPSIITVEKSTLDKAIKYILAEFNKRVIA